MGVPDMGVPDMGVPDMGVMCCVCSLVLLSAMCRACGVLVGAWQCAPPGGGTIGSSAGAGWDCWGLSDVGRGRHSHLQRLQPFCEVAL